MKILIFATLACAVCALSVDRMIPAVKSTVVTHAQFGVAVESTVAEAPLSLLPTPSTPANDVSPVWEQHQPIGIYSHVGLGDISNAKFGEDAVASTWLAQPLIEDLADSNAKPRWVIQSSDNAVQTEVAAARSGDTIVAAQWNADGYNLSGTVRVLSSQSDKPVWEVNLPGAGAGEGSIAMNADGSHFAIVANVNNSFVIPGHAQVQCYTRASSKPTFVIDLPQGQYAAQAAPTMSDDLRVAFSTSTVVYVADCSTGALLFSYNRGYIATALAMSTCGKYVATAFESVLVFQKTATSYEVLMNTPLTSGNASAPGLWIGAQVAFSSTGKLAVGTYNGYTAKQNRVVLFDLAAKNETWGYSYLPVDFQTCQDMPTSMEFTNDGKFLIVGSWGDQNHTNPTVSLFCAVCGKVVLGYNTPGSVEAVAATSSAEGVRIVAGGKHVHANLMGAGGDLYAFTFTPKTAEQCHAMEMEMEEEDLAAAVVSQAEIDRLNALPGMTWTAGKNDRFASMTMAEVKRMMGAIIDKDRMIEAGVPTEPRVFEELSDAPIPAEFSTAKAFPGCVHAVRDQQSCGSCWAFGGSETLSDRYCIAAAAKGKNVSVVLSAEEMVSCDTQDFGCGGGYLYYAWEFMEKSGLVADSCFPYTAGQGTAAPCASTCVDGEAWAPVKVKNGTLSYYGSEEQIQRALMAGGPIEVAFNVPASFMQYKSGVYQREAGSPLIGGHAVKMVGWGHDAASGLDYWEIYNSWGTSWGMNGTFWIHRGVNECGIEYNSIWGDVDV